MNKDLTLTEAFSQKTTENGDIAFSKASTDNLVNLLFMSEYYQNHTAEARIGDSEKERLFAMFMRDPRYGLGRRDLGRHLMGMSGCSIDDVVCAGRVDDLFDMPAYGNVTMSEILDWCRSRIETGDELVKKWMPRYSSKDLLFARSVASYYGMNKQQYGHFVKCDTTESRLSRKDTASIAFEHVPSQAMLKYAARFAKGEDTAERYAQYVADVKAGKKSVNVSTATVYDIYRKMTEIDADMFFDKIGKISGSWIPIVDTSGSMRTNDAFGKALSIGHYLSKCSTYAPNKVVSFSSFPCLIELGSGIVTQPNSDYLGLYINRMEQYKKLMINGANSTYAKEIASMYTGDCSNTNFAAVMKLLSDLGDLPEYIVVLSDMEFDAGSNMSKSEVEALWKEKGYKTKFIWWNLGSVHATAPETDERGNIFMSGYSPELLKYLESGFDSRAFLDKLLAEYAKKINK